MRGRAAAPPAPPQAQAYNSDAGFAHGPFPAENGYRPQQGLPTPAPTPPGAHGAYVPPSVRGGAPPVADDGGWGAPRPRPVAASYGGGGGGSAMPGYGAWKNGQHILGQRNPRMEKELYGEVGDGLHQVSYIVHHDRPS